MKNFRELENKTLEQWNKTDTFGKLQKQNAKGEIWAFMDGPVTANNRLGVHHAWGRTYKDIFQRYQAMKGKNLRWQNGFDCHGLWVEVEVEKELNIKNKHEIIDYGVKPFTANCRDRVIRFAAIQVLQSQKLGQWMDWENSYYTHHDNNIEHVWKFLSKCNDLNLIAQSERVMPWCTRCSTSLSQHELADSYTEENEKSIYVKFKINENNEHLLVWTTTPWTIPANAALAVNPQASYIGLTKIAALADGTFKKGKITIWLSELSPKCQQLIKEGWETIGRKYGKEFIGTQYYHPFNGMKKIIIPWSDILPESGTGIVHIAPGCGIDDFKLGKEHCLEIYSPLNEHGVYKEGFCKGLYYKDANKKIVGILGDMLFDEEMYTHRIPRCWRCEDKLVYRLCNEWFIKMEPIRQRLKEAANKINWIPSSSGEQIQNWLDNMGDWCISRRRFWGVPLPFFVCDKCDLVTVIGSTNEFSIRATEANCPLPKYINLHRPWIDNYFIKCKCGHESLRVSEVGDCWLDAAVAPLSTLDFANNFDNKWFPYDFAVEMREQVRLWFYSSLVVSVVMLNEPPFRNILTYDEMRDHKNEPFSKTKGNAPSLDFVIEQHGADTLRYTLAQAPINQPYRWDENNLKESQKKLLTIWNCFSFYQGYDKIYHPKISSPLLSLSIDKWIVSCLHDTINKVNKYLDEFNTAGALKTIETFALHDLSHWYIRIKRSVFSGEENKEQAFNVLYYVLDNLALMLAPFVPFIAEEFLSMLEYKKESIHLRKFPTPGHVDKKIIEKMSVVREIVSLTLRARETMNIRLRQPLHRMQFHTFQENGIAVMNMLNIVRDETNVKHIIFIGKPLGATTPSEIKIKGVNAEIILDCALPSNLIAEGMTRDFIRHVQGLRKKAGLTPVDRITITCQPPTGVAYYLKEVQKKTNAIKFTIAPVPKEMIQGNVKLGTNTYLVGIMKTH